MRAAFAVALLAVSASVAGCSSGGDSASTSPSTTVAATTSTISPAAAKAAFITAADKICQTMNEQSDALTKQAPASPNQAQLLEQLKQGQKLTEDTLAALRALPQPAGEEAALTALYAEVDEFVVLLESFTNAFTKLDREAVNALEPQVGAKTKAMNKHFRDYGLAACGREKAGSST